MTTLRALQERLLGAIVDGADVASTAALLTPGPSLSARERLQIYRGAYLARLVECLVDDYPAVAFAVGDAHEALFESYIAAHPSRSPSLNHFGRHMSAFLRDGARPDAAFLSELARLEWAIVETIHAPFPDALGLEAFSQVPADRWGDVRLTPSGRATWLDFRYPVEEYYRAFREEQSPVAPSPAATTTLVLRQGFSIVRLNVSQGMRGVLRALIEGETLGDALEAMEDELTPDDLTATFRSWVGSGIFARAILDEP